MTDSCATATTFDVTESFQALEDVNGTISIPDLQTIYLGLGFLPTRFATLTNLTKDLWALRNHNNNNSSNHSKSSNSKSYCNDPSSSVTTKTSINSETGRRRTTTTNPETTRISTTSNHVWTHRPTVFQATNENRLTLEETLRLLSKVRLCVSRFLSLCLSLVLCFSVFWHYFFFRLLLFVVQYLLFVMMEDQVTRKRFHI